MRHRRFDALLLMAMLLLSAPVQGAPLFGTSTREATAASYFCTIDPDIGTVDQLRAIGFNHVEALDVDPTTGVVYATGQRTGTDVPVLITIDLATGAGTEVGPTGIPDVIADLAFRADGTLFAVSGSTTSIGATNIFTINTITGVATLVGSTGLSETDGNGLAYDESSGILYLATGRNLYMINIATGTATLATDLPIAADQRITALDFHPIDPNDPVRSNVLYGIRNTFSSAIDHLTTINPMTGALSIVGSTNPAAGQTALDGLAWGALDVDDVGSVVLVSFYLSLNKGNVSFSWRTASEINNVGFELQRAELLALYDHPYFKPIASYLTSSDLVGLGSSMVGKKYSYTDDDPSLKPGVFYWYRLIDIASNGIRTFHPGRKVQIGVVNDTINKSALRLDPIIPNPTREFVNFTFTLPEEDVISVDLYSLDGRKVATPIDNRNYSGGDHAEAISVVGLFRGYYTLVLRTHHGAVAQQLIVDH